MISAIIITYNEENKIRDCLESVKWADEIIVADSFSTDNTLEIVREYTDKIFSRKWEGFAPQKDFAYRQAKGDWVLSIDADERISPELAEEIQNVLKDNPNIEGYKIPRRNFFLGKWIKSCHWYPDHQLRLFRNGKAKMHFVKVHEGFYVDGQIGILTKDIIHLTFDSLTAIYNKVNYYSTLAAEEKWKIKKVGAISIILHAFAAFFTDFISRRGFKEGMYGFMVSTINMSTNLLTYIKIWEKQRKENTTG
ncbi:MAG: glycosyltransferase family 2 protein [Ignavibacteriaceae bacterium]